MQPNCHNIAGYQGPPGSLTLTSPIPAGPRPLLRDPQPPLAPHEFAKAREMRLSASIGSRSCKSRFLKLGQRFKIAEMSTVPGITRESPIGSI